MPQAMPAHRDAQRVSEMTPLFCALVTENKFNGLMRSDHLSVSKLVGRSVMSIVISQSGAWRKGISDGFLPCVETSLDAEKVTRRQRWAGTHLGKGGGGKGLGHGAKKGIETCHHAPTCFHQLNERRRACKGAAHHRPCIAHIDNE